MADRMTSSTAAPDFASVRALFADRFGREPDVVASAPGRVNLIGEHTDYNGGEVLPVAIDQRTFVAMRRNDGSKSRAVSANQEDTGEFTSPDPVRAGGWWDYVSGHTTLIPPVLPQVEIAVTSDVPA